MVGVSGIEKLFQHTAARRRLGKALPSLKHLPCFNTQPPEGGWTEQESKKNEHQRFNTQPPEGGWILIYDNKLCIDKFQHTAARRRLASCSSIPIRYRWVSTHSRPKAAGASLKSLALSGFAAPISLSS